MIGFPKSPERGAIPTAGAFRPEREGDEAAHDLRLREDDVAEEGPGDDPEDAPEHEDDRPLAPDRAGTENSPVVGMAKPSRRQERVLASALNDPRDISQIE